MASIPELMDALERAENSKDFMAAQLFANEIKQMQGASQAQQGDQPTVMGRMAGGALEPLATLATGAVAGPLSGYAGMVAAGTKALGLTEMDPADVVRGVGRTLTYEPKSAGGRDAMSVIGYLPEKLAEGADYTGGKVSEVTGSPAFGAGVNALIQAAVPGAVAKGASVVAPKIPGFLPRSEVNPNVKHLDERGITMTPGKVWGGLFGGAESILNRILGEWSPAKGANARSLQQFRDTVYADTLGPIGKEAPKGMTGHTAAQHLEKTISDDYGRIIPNLVGDLDVRASGGGTQLNLLGQPGGTGTSFRMDLAKVKQMSNNLPADYARALRSFIDNNVLARFTQQGKAGGDTLQMIKRDLDTEIARFNRGGPWDTKVADGLQSVRNSLMDMLKRENPQWAPQLTAADNAWEMFRHVEEAIKHSADPTGNFNPVSLSAATRKLDQSVRDRKYTQGQASRLQPLAQAAEDVLGANGGRPSYMPGYLPHALMAGYAGSLVNPVTAVAAATVPMAYSGVGMRALQALKMRPEVGGQVGAAAIPFGGEEYGQRLEQVLK